MSEAADKQIIRPPGLAEEVYHRIRADIMSLKIPPDSRIPVDGLARELGVSHTPIREALSMLEANGLVLKQRFVGYCTASRMDRSDLDELFEFRLLIEPHAAAKAADSMTPAQVRNLTGVAGNKALSHDAFADMDTQFHQLIAQGGGNHLISDSLERLHIHVHIFRSCFRQEITKEAIVEHAEVLKAIRGGNGVQAEKAMRRHIERSYARLRSFIQDQPRGGR